MSNDSSTAQQLAQRFREMYGTEPRIFRAPGRVNLIGEHTDYNDGFVMPAAIASYTWVAAAPRQNGKLSIYSDHFQESMELPIQSLNGPGGKHWSNYVRGVAAILQSRGGALSGADLLIHGEVPLGAGLSSSASLEVASAIALSSLSNLSLPPLEFVKICQRAEHEYVGTRCGIMDQFIAVFAQAGNALLLDCRSLEYKVLPIAAQARLLICNSMVKHELAAGEYNRRRADCEAGVAVLRRRYPDIQALRDATPQNLEQCRSELSDTVYRRCRHVITENARVLAAAEALEVGNLAAFGRLMYQSHDSLRDDYEVSCVELDTLVTIASTCDGVYGARMTGGGFGGCTINLVRENATPRVREQLILGYEKAFGKRPEIYVCSAADGAIARPEIEVG